MIWGTIFGNIQVVVSHAIFYILLQPNEMIQLRHIFYRMGCNQHFLKSVWRISETKPGGRVETSCRLSAFAGESPSYSTDLFGEGLLESPTGAFKLMGFAGRDFSLKQNRPTKKNDFWSLEGIHPGNLTWNLKMNP